MMIGPEPITSTFLILGSFGISTAPFHAVDAADILQKAVKQELGILGAAVCFGVELHRKAVPLQVFNSLTGFIVGVHMADAAGTCGQSIAQNRIAVVLAGNEM